MILLFFILFLFSLFLFWGVNKMYNNGMLDKKQYRFYILLIIIFWLFVAGQLNTITGLGTDNELLN